MKIQLTVWLLFWILNAMINVFLRKEENLISLMKIFQKHWEISKWLLLLIVTTLISTITKEKLRLSSEKFNPQSKTFSKLSNLDQEELGSSMESVRHILREENSIKHLSIQTFPCKKNQIMRNFSFREVEFI